jgi:hypothetical protein
VAKIQEYVLEIRHTKLTKGQGLAQMLTKGNEAALGMKEEYCLKISIVIEELEKRE